MRVAIGVVPTSLNLHGESVANCEGNDAKHLWLHVVRETVSVYILASYQFLSRATGRKLTLR